MLEFFELTASGAVYHRAATEDGLVEIGETDLPPPACPLETGRPQFDDSSSFGVSVCFVVAAFDLYVGSMLRPIRAFGLRKREAIMFRPNECQVNFADTGLPLAEKQGEDFVWVRQGAKVGRPRFVPMNTSRRRQAIASARQVADWDQHAHTGDPDRDLKQNMVRFGYVLRKFGITSKGLAITAHGLRHEALIEECIAITGQEPPLRGGGEGLTREQEDAARLAASRLAGHDRGRASAAHLGAVLHKKKGGAKGGAGGGGTGGDAEA